MKISIHIDKIETKEAYAEGIDLVIEDVNLEDVIDLGELSFEDLIALVQEAEAEKAAEAAQEDVKQGSELEKLIKSLEEQKKGFEQMKEEEGKAQDNPFADNPFFKVISGQISELPKNPLTDVLGAFIEAQKEGKGPKFQ